MKPARNQRQPKSACLANCHVSQLVTGANQPFAELRSQRASRRG